jgi:hypothetical protein
MTFHHDGLHGCNSTVEMVHDVIIIGNYLYVLTQISSAAVERIFSQVKLICETTGDSPLEENLEVRLFERCNVYPAGI